MEIDELYADVIVARLQKLAGQPAALEATGQTFEITAQARRQ